MFLAEQPGRVLLLGPDNAEAQVLLDISYRVEAERGVGLLSVALAPGFNANGYSWAYYYADEPALPS